MILNRRGAIVDGDFYAVGPNQNGMIEQADDLPIAQNSFDRVLDRLTSELINDVKNIAQRTADRLLRRITQQSLRDGICERHPSFSIGSNNRIADAFESNAQPVAAFYELTLRGPTLGDVSKHQHSAGNAGFPGLDRCGAIVYRSFGAILCDEKAMICETYDEALLQSLQGRIVDPLASLFADNLEYFVQ
ncbi:MAG TPA: hypothetical protein VFB82_01315, partial [Blastocatellia bacterium]|nr:hypothetical protein [Blastocatellia bacterium]